jgi:hypothetical protein
LGASVKSHCYFGVDGRYYRVVDRSNDDKGGVDDGDRERGRGLKRIDEEEDDDEDEVEEEAVTGAVPEQD